MTTTYRQIATTLSLFLFFGSTSIALNAEERDSSGEPYRVWIDGESDEEDADWQFALDSEADLEYFFVQEGAADSAVAPPSLSRSEAVAARRRRSTYRLPSMFGDYFGGGIFQASVLGQPVVLQQMLLDGQGGVNFFVQNANGGAGADPNPAVPIQILSGGNPIATSIGPGNNLGGNVTYPISDPTTTGFSPPMVNQPGVLVYDGGTAAGPIGGGTGWALDFQHTFTPVQGVVQVPSGGAAVRRFKLSENNSPIPRDRFIANYNFFNDVIGGIGDVNRYAFGFEKTFLNESSSIEVLFPFASTLSADQVAGGVIAKNTEFGDIPIFLKTILAERDEYVLSGGLGITLPTGTDARVFNMAGDQIIHVDHASVHLLPYLALLRAYDSGWYWQSFLQLDIDTSGNNIQADLTGANLQPVGVLQDQTLLFADLGVGYQFTQLGEGCSQAIAATAELHYATPLQSSDSITAGSLDLRNLVNRFDVVNLTLGLNVLTNHNFSIRPAMVIPLNDDQFDYEAMVQANFWR